MCFFFLPLTNALGSAADGFLGVLPGFLVIPDDLVESARTDLFQGMGGVVQRFGDMPGITTGRYGIVDGSHCDAGSRGHQIVAVTGKILNRLPS